MQNTNINQLVGARIKLTRTRKGVTQATLARQMGVSIPTLTRIERGDAAISVPRLLETATALDVSEGWLLNLDGKVSEQPDRGQQTLFRAWLKLSRRSRSALVTIAAALVEAEGGRHG